MIYLDNAATTYPKPRAVTDAAHYALTRAGANPGRGAYSMAEQAGELVYRARLRVCEFFSVKEGSPPGVSAADLSAYQPQRVIFTPGCTWSINTVLKGTRSSGDNIVSHIGDHMITQKGDHVIISDLEHNAVVRPLERLRRNGVEVTRVHIVEGDPDATMRNFERAIRRNTKMVFCTHASNVFGVMLPAGRIAEMCRRRGLLFGLDCAQSAGTIPLGFDTVPADFMCMPAHKGLYGMMGCGLLLLGGDRIPEPLCEGGTGSLSALREMPPELPDRLEPGTLNVPGIAALDAGIGEIQRIGREKIMTHEMTLVRELYERLTRINGVTLYTMPPAEGTHVPLLSFNIGDLPSEQAAERLARYGIAVRAGFHCAYDAHTAYGTQERGTVRVCPSMFTSGKDIDAVTRAVYEIARGKQ